MTPEEKASTKNFACHIAYMKYKDRLSNEN